jgi:hypothetical protein
LARYQILGGKERGWDQIANPRFWELTNTRYLLSNIDTLPIPGATRVAGPTTTSRGSRVSLFDLPGEQPYAWVTPLMVKAPDDAVLGTVLDPRFNLATAALFDTSAAVRAVDDVETLPSVLPITVRVASYSPGAVALELDAPAPEGAALVVSENYYPGWRATADGQPATLGRAQFSFIGVELPTGARRVQLTFSNGTYATGKLVTLIALMLAAIWLLTGVLLGKRQTRRGIV